MCRHPTPPQPKARQRTSGSARRGRHFGPRPVDDPRSAWLTTRTTPEFLAKVRADAKAAGLPLSDYLHVELGGKRSPRAKRHSTKFEKLIAQGIAFLGRPGSNMNQCARVLNELYVIAREIGADELAERIDAMLELYNQAYAEHRECVAEMMRLLGMRPQ